MFRRKTSLPDRPPFPNGQQIKEDFLDADENDVLFQKDPTHVLKDSNGLDNWNSHADSKDAQDSLGDEEVLKDPSKAYEKVKSFLDVCSQLEESVEVVERERQRLLNLSDDLALEIVRVKHSLGGAVEQHQQQALQ